MTNLITIVAAVAILFASPAVADMSGPCASIEIVKGILAQQGQSIIGFGQAPTKEDGGGFIVFLAADPAGNWTMLFSGDGNTLCMAAGGDGWTPVEPPVPGKDT